MRESTRLRPVLSPHVGGEGGSILLFVLFVCLGLAIVVQTLSAVVLCADRAAESEKSGRMALQDKDGVLAALRAAALKTWGPLPWNALPGVSEWTEGALMEVPAGGGWTLLASARSSADAGSVVVSGDLERGRDGVDLPFAAMVAAGVWCAPGRSAPWLELEEGGTGTGGQGPATGHLATAYLVTQPTDVPAGPGVTVERLAEEWALDQGWRSFFEARGTDADGGGPSGTGPEVSPGGVAFGAGVVAFCSRRGTTVGLSQEWGMTEETPGMVVVTGGATLDARGGEDRYGVIVVDQGGVLLEGTRLHGAVFATGTVELGADGVVEFCPGLLRWATDRSLSRCRLIPGTREESIE